jgi:hypothetical protein
VIIPEILSYFTRDKNHICKLLYLLPDKEVTNESISQIDRMIMLQGIIHSMEKNSNNQLVELDIYVIGLDRSSSLYSSLLNGAIIEDSKGLLIVNRH